MKIANNNSKYNAEYKAECWSPELIPFNKLNPNVFYFVNI